MQMPYEKQDLVNLLQATPMLLWGEWPKDMQLSSFDSHGFVLNGECPHCRKQAAFVTIADPFEERQGNYPSRMISAARCIACNEYILAMIRHKEVRPGSFQWAYDAHYPLGLPHDEVAPEIPDAIKPDFQEALRCRWVKAYNATIEMCGRALEASCIEQGAPSDEVLSKMIDWVHKQGKITTPLRDMAHKIKLGRNLAAHAQSDRTLTAEDADAVLDFTWEYFHHIYTMPAALAKHNFDKPGKKKP